MRFYVLPVGSCEDDKGKIFSRGKDDGEKIVAPNWVGLICANGLNILIDTGMHPIHIQNSKATFEGTKYENIIIPMMNKEDFVINQLKLPYYQYITRSFI